MGSTEKANRLSRESRRQLLQMFAIGLTASIIGIAAGLAIDWFPTQASEEGSKIDGLWDVLLVVSIPIFVLVQGIVLYCVWKFRVKPGEELKDGPPIHGNTRLEIIWTAIPAIILVGLCSYAYAVLLDIEEAQGNDELPVTVIGEQFTWTFQYDNPDGGGERLTSSRLYLPVDRPVHFTVQSKDVIHDFWVPAFRMKIDAVRGVDTELRVTPDRVGEYPVVCAELCGLGHSAMRQTAHVVPPDEFDTWLASLAEGGNGAPGTAGGQEQEEDEDAAAGGAPADGAAVFVDSGCGGCHALADAGTTGGTGPDLDESLAGADPAFIEQGIIDPGAEVAEGFQDGLMPADYQERLDPADLDALVQYLAEVTG